MLNVCVWGWNPHLDLLCRRFRTSLSNNYFLNINIILLNFLIIFYEFCSFFPCTTAVSCCCITDLLHVCFRDTKLKKGYFSKVSSRNRPFYIKQRAGATWICRHRGQGCYLTFKCSFCSGSFLDQDLLKSLLAAYILVAFCTLPDWGPTFQNCMSHQILF